MQLIRFAAALMSAAFVSAPAGALVLDFDALPPGSVLGSQYAAQGVTFTNSAPNAFSGGAWATNTDLTVVSIDTGVLGEDYSALGSPGLVSGHILRRYLNWLAEDGDPSFAIVLSVPATQVGVTFAGVDGAAGAAAVRLVAYSGTTLLSEVAGSLPDANVGQLALSVSGSSITRVVVVPGGFDDWVGIDLITITPVDEPAGWTLLASGGALLAALRRRNRGRAQS